MLIRIDDTLRHSFNHPKLRNFISLWKMVKNTIKVCRKFILRKKPALKCFLHLRVWFHLRQIRKLSTLSKLMKTSQNFWQVYFFIKLKNKELMAKVKLSPMWENYISQLCQNPEVNQEMKLLHWWIKKMSYAEKLNKLEKKFTGEEKKTNSPENKLQ